MKIPKMDGRFAIFNTLLIILLLLIPLMRKVFRQQVRNSIKNWMKNRGKCGNSPSPLRRRKINRANFVRISYAKIVL